MRPLFFSMGVQGSHRVREALAESFPLGYARGLNAHGVPTPKVWEREGATCSMGVRDSVWVSYTFF